MNNTVPLENSIPGNCCSALFKNLVRGPGAQEGSPRLRGSPWEGWRGPRKEAHHAFASHPPPPFSSPWQLLKKIKRCERKGTESVTEEKCAVLFSTSFTLGPNKLLIQLQVSSADPSLLQPGTRILLSSRC